MGKTSHNMNTTTKYFFHKPIIWFGVVLCFAASNVYAQTVIFQSGFEAADPVFTGSSGANTTVTQPIASTPNTGVNSGKIFATATNTSFTGSIITGSTIPFVAGRYYTIDVYARVGTVATSTLKIGKTSTATNAAMVALTGGDQLLWPGSANVTSATYALKTVTFLATATESKYVGIQVVSGAAGGSVSTIYIDDIRITEYIDAPCGAYCSSAGTTNTVGYISNVLFNTVNRTSIFDGYICTGTSTTVNRECSYDLTVEKTNNGAYTTYTAAWIDWNKDGVFNTTDEYVLTSGSTAAASGVTSRTQSITIPITATLGNTKMRVFYKYNTTIATNGCDNGTIYEDVEDYDITIISPVLPSCASGYFPISGATLSSCSSTTASLSWTAPIECVSNYKVYFDQNPSPTTLVSTQPGLSYTTGALAAGTYYWKIVPTNSVGDATGCTIQSFILSATIAAPTAPNVSYCSAPYVFTLSATGGSYSNYFWYDASSGGNFLGSGSTYTTPSLGSTTSYYVEDANLTSEANLLVNSTAGSLSAGKLAIGFNVTNSTANTLIITQVSERFSSLATGTADVYYRSGTYVGNMTSSAGWTAVGNSLPFNVTSTAVPTLMDIPDIIIPAGATYGFYIFIDRINCYYNGAAANVSDANIAIAAGSVVSASPTAAFTGGTLVATASFVGNVYYQIKSCISSRTTCQAIFDAAIIGGSNYGIYAPDGTITVTDCQIINNTNSICGGNAFRVGTGTAPVTNVAYTNVLIASMNVINAGDATNGYTNCTSTNMNMVTAAGSPDWTSSSAPLTGTGSPKTVSYTTTGRKTVLLAPAVNSTVTLFSDNFEGTASGWTGQATSTPGSSQNYWVMGTTSTAKSGWYTGGSGGCGANNTVLTGSYSPRVSYYKSGNPGAGLYCNYSAAAVATANLRLISPSFSTVGYSSVTLTFNYVGVMNANDNVQLQYKIGAGAWTNIAGELYNASVATTTLRTVALPAACDAQASVYIGWNFNSTTAASSAPPTFIIDDIAVTKTVSVANVYTDFNNMLMAAPTGGSISGVTPLCSGTSGTFSSSTSGTPGFTYVWSVVDPAGCSSSVTGGTTSASSITFTNPLATAQTFSVNVAVSSECCGVLTPPTTYTVTVNPPPVAPTASATPSPICPGASSTLAATAPASCSFQWYDAATGGSLLASTASYAVTPAVTTSYYVQATTIAGCPGPRATVTVTVTPTTAPVTVNGSSCGAGNITVSISAPVAGYIYNFYTGSCGGALVQSNTATSYTAFTAATTTYYVNAVAPGGCAASTCQTATATIGSPANPLVWLGAVGGLNNWFNTANWTGGCLPTCTDNVLIPAPTGNNPDIGFNPAGPAACKDITLGSSGTPTLSFSDSKAELDVCGNFTHTTTLTTGNLGRVVFMGTTAQTYTRTGTGSFNDVTLNNTAGTATLTIGGANDMVLGTAGTFTFQSGKVITNANKLIINNIDPASMSGYAAGRYVEGNLRRYLNTAATGTYDFPVGIANNGISTNCYELARVNFTQAPATITYLTAYFNGWGGSVPGALGSTECLATYNNVALDNGYWQIDAPASTNNNGMYDMTLYNTAYSNAAAGWTIMSMHSPSVTWALLNGDGSSGTCVVSPVTAVLRKNMKGFSKFATAQSTTPLPIELLTFEAAYNGKTVDVKWITASEVNNNYFTVERSTNAIDFNDIGTVPSKAINGNSSSPLDYYLNDADVQSGVYYYRLKQTDFNGTYNYSNIVSVTIDDNAIFIIKPNPTTTTSDVIYTCFGSENATLKVFDYRGRLVVSKDLLCTKGQNITTIDLSEQPDGMFFVTLTTNEKVYKTKLLKSK